MSDRVRRQYRYFARHGHTVFPTLHQATPVMAARTLTDVQEELYNLLLDNIDALELEHVHSCVVYVQVLLFYNLIMHIMIFNIFTHTII